MIHDYYKKWEAGEHKFNKRQIAVLKTWEAFVKDTSKENRASLIKVANCLESTWDFSED